MDVVVFKQFLFILLAHLKETVTSRIVNPWIVVWTSDASLKVNGLSWNLFAGQLARVWYPAGWITFDHTFFFPGVEVLRLGDCTWILDPLDDLRHRDKVDVIVVAQNLIHPEEEGVQVLGVVFEPSCVKIESQRCSVLVVVAVEIVVEEVIELVTRQNVGAGVDHSAAWKVFVEVWVLSTVQLIQYHLPDSVASGGAVL